MAYLDDAKSENQEELQEEVVVEQEVQETPAEENIEQIETTGKKSKKKGAGKVKATVSELKKVTWPTFGKVVKQTIVVLSVTAAFLLVVVGIDQLLYLLYNFLTKNM
ncbi:MAG: preprotein translocase subunit SecE [Clostridiales bacterium]|nr:preprotein translocase subunit SecE [Clostridiales bacterium]